MRSHRFLVTGCTGYIARFLIRALRKGTDGAYVAGLSRRAPDVDVASLLSDHFPVDLRSGDDVTAVVRGVKPTTVIHLASERSGELDKLLETNAVGTNNLLDTCRDICPGSRVVVIGSSAEIGYCAESDLPVDETVQCRPVDAYGISKLTQSMVGLSAFQRYNQDVVRLRLFNILGPDLPESLLGGRCVCLLGAMVQNPGAIELKFGDLSTTRDYTDVRDASRAIMAAVRKGKSGALYHIGSGNGVTGRELVQRIIDCSNISADRVTVREEVDHPSVVPIQICDAGLAAAELDWTPQRTLDKTIADIWWATSAVSSGHQKH